MTEDTGGIRLHPWEWLVERPVVTVALCHGYGEHAGRYAHVGRALNRESISVVAADLRGHGRSPGGRGEIERFTDYLADLDVIVAAARERSGGGPVALLGHSMGGLIACDWLLRRSPGALTGVVLTSPFLELPRAPRLLAALLGPLSGPCPRLRAGIGFTGADLTHDPRMIRAHAEDPLVLRHAVLRTITEARKAARRVRRRAAELRLPTLLLFAGSDRIVAADATERFAGRLRMADLTSRRLPGLHHEILNESPEVRGALLSEIAAWLRARAAPAQ